MPELLTSAQMRAIEAAAIASGSVTGLDLMEQAGRGVVEAVLAEWPELAEGRHRAVILCGPGNNGGDGFVVARLLQGAGWDVEVFLYGEAETLPPDARVNHARWLLLGQVVAMDGQARPQPAPELIVDAVFGTGLTRPLPPEVVQTFRAAFTDRANARFVGVDCASGDCMDSGRPLGDPLDNPFARDLIVQFHRAKVGQYLNPAAGNCASLRLVDIGLSGTPSAAVRLAKPLGRLGKGGSSHKFTHGHALILSGGVGRGGAARLAARGALRIGAGLVTLACPPAALIENAAQLDAVMLRAVTDGAALAALLEDRRINALCLGPGLGVARAAEMLAAALPTGRAMVIDADALTALAGDAALSAQLHPACVLTPHGGEFARLFPDIAARLEAPARTGPAYSKVDATREAARRACCIVLFKGPDTVIAGPDGQCRINCAAYGRAAPWLATAGAGDVLAGFIAGLLARGFEPMPAAETAAWLHVEAARAFGPGLIAEDLPDALPGVFRLLGL